MIANPDTAAGRYAVSPDPVCELTDDVTVSGQRVYSRGNTAEAAKAAEPLRLCKCQKTEKLQPVKGTEDTARSSAFGGRCFLDAGYSLFAIL